MAKSKKAVIQIEVAPKPKKKPRGKLFSKDNPSPTQFKPGQSGNPGGRPKGSGSKIISKAYEAALEQVVPEEVKTALGLEGDVTWADAIALTQVRVAVQLPNARINQTAVSELREVTEGKLVEKSEFSGAGGTPLQAPVFQVGFVKPEEPAPTPVAPTSEK